MSGSPPVKSSGGVLVVFCLVTQPAQIVCFPASIRNASFAKQAFRDFAVAIPFQPSIQRTQSEDEVKTGLGR
ncbi:hypothetical protein XI06_24765 [Bradyrhizobium sp. CCBAU 11434]|nr:hypothetical protein [Bradyrhizobium sp. CCBAU 11434]